MVVVEGCAAENRSTWVVSLVLVPTTWMTAGNQLHRFRKPVEGLHFVWSEDHSSLDQDS